MKICMYGSQGELQGDLIDTGLVGSCIDSLSEALRKIETGRAKKISLDCGRILRADLGGLRILYVWMQCARFRGVELELVNLSECLRQVMRSCGVRSSCFTSQPA